MTNINELVQKAMKSNVFHPSRTDGKLNGFKPLVNDVAVFSDGFTGVVIKAPNSAGDYLVELPSGERMRENLCTGSVVGFIRE